MKRSTALILTVATTLVCGLPSLFLCFLGVFAILGSQMPSVMSQYPQYSSEQILLGSGMYLCFGAALLLPPILVGIFSFQMSKKSESTDTPPSA